MRVTPKRGLECAPKPKRSQLHAPLETNFTNYNYNKNAKAKTSTATEPIIYLQLTSLESFIAELKRRGISEARLSEWSRRRGLFEQCKLRLTALDKAEGVILRYDHTFYYDFAVIGEHEHEKHSRAREEAKRQISAKLDESGIRLLDGEYHNGKAEW